MSDSGYRLAPPNPAVYETSGGEQAILRGLDPKNIGMLLGPLLGQRADTMARATQYGDELRNSNIMQAELSRDRLAEEGRRHDGTVAASLAERGLDLPNVLQAARLRGLQVQQSPEASAAGILQSQRLRDLASRAGSIDKLGSGLYNMAQAGVNVDEGQQLARPDDAANARLTVGQPLSLRREAMEQAGANGRAALKAAGDDEGGPIQMKVKIDPLSQMPTLEQKGGTVQEQAYYASKFSQWVNGGGFRNGTPFDPGAPPAASGSAVPTGSKPASGSNPLLGDLPISPETQRLLNAGNMGSARGATPPPPSATPPGTPARATASGTGPSPQIVERARSMPGVGTYRGTEFYDGKWYAHGSLNGKPTRVEIK